MLPEPVTVTSLSIPNTITFEEWLATGRQLASTTRDLGFMIGDWVNHGRTQTWASAIGRDRLRQMRREHLMGRKG